MKLFENKLIFLILFFSINVLKTFGSSSSDESEDCSSDNVTITEIEFVQTSPNTFDIYLTAVRAVNVYSIQLVFKIGETEYSKCIRRTDKLVEGTKYLLFSDYQIFGLIEENVIQDLVVKWHTTAEKTCQKSFNNDQCSTPKPETITLPVIWHNFSATLQPGSRSVALNWSTLKEWESSHFEIERSENGIASFEKIGEEKSVGWSDAETSYQFLDRYLPLDHSRLYYRIKQVDFDGTTDYSATRMVESPKSNLRIGWQAYPNPTQNQSLFLRSTVLFRNRENPITVKISSMDSGQSVTFQTYEAELDLSNYIKNFPKGLLVIEIINPDSVELLKVVHQ